MSYQGVLTDSEGNPVPDGNYNFLFKIYLQASGGDAIWEESQVVVVSGGLFDAVLGLVSPLDLPFDRPYYLGLSVDGGSEMSPRIPLSASPYSLTARTVADSVVTGAKIADGQVVRSVNGLTDKVILEAEGGATITIRGDTIVINAGSGTGPGTWSLTGNAGTNPATHFLGTTDNQALEVRVNNQRALRIEPGDSPNLVGGYSGNSVADGAVGATIAGGGASGETHRVFDNYGTVSGGLRNRAGSEDGDPTDAPYATVAGGRLNIASGGRATVGGGGSNTASGDYATVSGGQNNTASGSRATVGGGWYNQVTARYGTIAGGGPSNTDDPTNTNNRVLDDYGTIGGGGNNQAGSDDGDATTAPYATVGGGGSNTASGLYATVGGGLSNTASDGSATVGGGFGNGAHGRYATVGGGDSNFATGYAATVPGGYNNGAAGSYSFAAGRQARANHDGTFVWADDTFAFFESTGTNQFLVRAGGGVGLGTNSPQAQLHVQEAINASATLANHVAIIENNAPTTGNGPDVLALKTSAIGNPGASTNFITFFDGNDNSLGAIQGDGNGGVTLAGPGNDYAEWLPLRYPAESVQAGDIVAWTPQGITLRTGEALRLMVVSTQPIVAGNVPMDADRSDWAPVAFVGQAWVKVRGPVQAGDFILPSGKNDGSGVAVSPEALRVDQVGQVVGRVLENAEGAGFHRVKVLVGLPHNDILQVLLLQRDARLAQQQARLDVLEAENAQLRVQMRNLEARLEALEQKTPGHATSAAVGQK
ncbi:MAG: hypothetical protein Q9M35_02505 [Rhodothermus sp.]|nr:hypothetical protein [Rhodothermus sp.]